MKDAQTNDEDEDEEADVDEDEESWWRWCIGCYIWRRSVYDEKIYVVLVIASFDI